MSAFEKLEFVFDKKQMYVVKPGQMSAAGTGRMSAAADVPNCFGMTSIWTLDVACCVLDVGSILGHDFAC